MFKDGVFLAVSVPRNWLLPRKERAVLASIAVVFWGSSIWQAVFHNTSGASVFSLFGLGLLYLIFSISNLAGGLRIALTNYHNNHVEESHPRALVELLVVLLGMALLNGIILVVYLLKGTSFTFVDTLSLGIDVCIVIVLIASYGLQEVLRHPIAKGWLAIAGKTIPQLILAGLFITNPTTASGIAFITLLGIDTLSLLRFIPTIKGYRQDKHNHHLRGLLLGEAGNTLSGLLLTAAWLVAHIISV